MAVLAEDLGSTTVDIGFDTEIGRMDAGAAATGRDDILHTLQLFTAPGHQTDVRSLPGQLQRSLLADAAGRPGDDDHLSVGYRFGRDLFVHDASSVLTTLALLAGV